MMKVLQYSLFGLVILQVPNATSFSSHHRPSFHHSTKVTRHDMSLSYEEHPTEVEISSVPETTPTAPTTAAKKNDPHKKKRNELKKELAKAAITDYDAEKGKNMYAEEIMKQLEEIKPWDQPIYDERMNARWSFVFTGVPTIGMRLITILSRISVGFPIVDFRDVYLEVTDDQSLVKAVVAVKMFGVPVELNVRTSLAPDTSDPEGVMMLEHFEGLILGGQRIPTPESWSKTRTLEISYLDEDLMIARTAGGEPHMLLRNSPCSSEDEECDIDNDLTEFFMEAREMYGERITRCLVDRDYGDHECEKKPVDPVMNILNMDPSELFGPWAKKK